MNFRHKKLVATLALASQGLGGFGGFAAKADAAEVPDETAETVVSSGVDRNEADSDSVPLPETGDETGLASRIVPHGAKLGIPLVGGAALLAGLAAFVGHKLFSSGKSVEGVETDPIPLKGDASSSYSLTLDIAGQTHKSLPEWFWFIKEYLADAGKHIMMWGPSSSGKTSLLGFLQTGTFKKSIEPTIYYSELPVGKSDTSTRLWDCSGQEHYNDLVLLVARKADLAILVLAYTDPHIKINLKFYVDCLEINMEKNKPIMVVLNKKDLPEPVVTSDEIRVAIEAKITDREWLLYEASAKTGESNLIAWSGKRPT